MSAVILADQPDGAGPGVAGKARNDLWLDREIVFTEAGAGNSTWLWTLLAKPHASAAAVSASTTQSMGLTPDQPGTYRVSCLVDEGLPTEATVIRVFRVRYSSTGSLLNRGYVVPALEELGGESNYDIDFGEAGDPQPNDLGWGEPVAYFMHDVHSRVAAVESAGPGAVLADAAALTSFDMEALADGTFAYVSTFDDLFELELTSTATVDGVTVIATSSGTGRWLRVGNPAIRWRMQEEWFIDADAGDDEATGASGFPIRTQAEWRRRTGGQPMAPMDINFISDTAEPMVWDVLNTFENRIFVMGVRSAPIFTGMMGSVQNWDDVAKTDGRFTDASIPVSWTASGYVGKLGVVTSGTSVGKTFWVAKDLGAQTARFSHVTEAGDFAIDVVANGDTYTLHDQTKLTGEQIFFVRGHESALHFYDIEFGTLGAGSHQHRSVTGSPYFIVCKTFGFDVQGEGRPQMLGCYISNNSLTRIYESGALTAFACFFPLGVRVHRGWFLPESCSTQGSVVLEGLDSKMILGASLVFLDVANGLTMGSFSVADLTFSVMWGLGVTGTGVSMAASARLLFDEPIDMATPAIEIDVGGETMLFSELPFTNANGAMALSVVSGVPTTGGGASEAYVDDAVADEAILRASADSALDTRVTAVEPYLRSLSVDFAAAQAYADVGAVIPQSASTATRYQLTLQVDHGTIVAGEGSLPAANNTRVVDVIVKRDGSNVATFYVDGDEDAAPWTIGHVDVQLVDSAGSWKLQAQRNPVDAPGVYTGSASVRVRAQPQGTVPWTSAATPTLDLFGGGGALDDPTLRAVAATLTATLDVNNQTVSDCAGVTRASGDIAETATSGSLTKTASGNFDVSVGGNLVINTSGGYGLISSAASDMSLSAIGNVNLSSPAAVNCRNYYSGAVRISLGVQTDVATAATSRAVLATVAVPTGPMRRLRASAKGWPAGAAGGAWTIDLHAENVAGTVTKFAETIALVAGTQNLGTIDATVNGTNLEIGVTPASGSGLTWHVNDLGDL